MNKCPYCKSSDVDWGFDSDTSPGVEVRDYCLCLDCDKTWDMIYKFDRWESDTQDLPLQEGE